MTTLDPQTQALITAVIRRESRSLLQYVGATYPWLSPDADEVAGRLRLVIEEEKNGMSALLRFLDRRRLPVPYLGAFPLEFADTHFTSLSYLLSQLARLERLNVVALEKDLAQMIQADLRALVQGYWELKRRHLAILEELAGTACTPA